MAATTRPIVPRSNAAPLLAATTLLLGCAGCATYRATREMQVAHQPGKTLRVRTDNGGVKISKSTLDQVEITATLQAQSKERLEAARIVADRQADGTLFVTVEWPGGLRWSNEGCGFEISLPDAVGLNVETSNGAIAASGLAGEAQLETSNGAIAVTDHDGPVHGATSNGTIILRNVSGDTNARSSNGTIVIEAAGGPIKAVTSNGRVQVHANPDLVQPISARTSNGRITIHDAGGPVDAITSNASVELQLAPHCPGPVHVESSNGGINLELGPAFTGELELDTSLGRIHWNDSGPAKNVRLLAMDRSSAHLAIGDSAQASSVRTSNANISVRFNGQ